MAQHLVNLEKVSKAYGTVAPLAEVSLGLDAGDRVGVVGRNGTGKTTLLDILTGTGTPDSGRVSVSSGVTVGYLHQAVELPPGSTVRDAVLAGFAAEYEWAGDARIREVLDGLGLHDVGLDAVVDRLSGGERRRVALAALLITRHDLLVLDEPTNHLDVEGIGWLADHLAGFRGGLVVVSHDRWFLDAVCTQTWEVHDGVVDRYEGGYAAYVLARAERARLAAVTEERRQNLLRKELAWLRRGPPARTSKPKFRIDAAETLIAAEPPPRDELELRRFAVARLGKTVYDLEDVSVRAGDRVLFDHLTWRPGPGDRIGVVGVNGSGKTTLLRLLTGEVTPDAGRVVVGKTVRAAYLSQEVRELPDELRVLEAVEEIRRYATLGGTELSASQLLERFGFTGQRRWTLVGDLSGGERRRLQLMRLLMSDPNVLLLDEPTNDLDIDTLTALEDLLDGWPGTLIVVSHDRYLIERVTDVTVALLGDGRLSQLPGGVDEYLSTRERQRRTAAVPREAGPKRERRADSRTARKELTRLERQLERLQQRAADLEARLAEHATDYEKVSALDAELREVRADIAATEERWLELADEVD
ncbi:MAG: ABC-F family ATP-binding cassette domain-containing protein [Mycobacteriales bacterium]